MDSGKPLPPPKHTLIILFMYSVVDYTTYNVSKIGLNRLTELQAKAFASDPTRPGILVNSVSTFYLANSHLCRLILNITVSSN